jgi:hypothetical protein
MGRSGTKTRFYLKAVLDIVGSDPDSSVVEAQRNALRIALAMSLLSLPPLWQDATGRQDAQEPGGGVGGMETVPGRGR